jgi:hypothetical protein
MTQLKHAILAADDLPREAIATPEWPGTDGKLFVRTMTAAERVAFSLSLSDRDDNPRLDNYWARLAVLTLTDAEGKRVFEDADAEALGRKSGDVLARVAAAAKRLNGLGEYQESARKN